MLQRAEASGGGGGGGGGGGERAVAVVQLVVTRRTAAAETDSLRLSARVRGGRFCRRAVLVLASPQANARHQIELRATILDSDGLALGGDVEAFFELQTRP